MSNTAMIELRRVQKGFALADGFLPVLNDADLSIETGSFVTILGPSGCGKSTLLRLIIGLEQPDAGTVLVNGSRVNGPGLDRGVVFQDPRLLPWRTARQNVALGLTNTAIPKARKRELVDEHLALVGLEQFANLYPYQLSGGMAQRVAIARALVNRPPVLLLDEPFSALDPITRESLQDVLLDIWRHERLTVVMITHEVEEAAYLSDRIVVMRTGPDRSIKQIDVDLSRPRDRDGFDFTTFRRRTKDILSGKAAPNETGRILSIADAARPQFKN